MLKFAILCGALVLVSASVNAQSRDSKNDSHDRSAPTRSAPVSRPRSDSGIRITAPRTSDPGRSRSIPAPRSADRHEPVRRGSGGSTDSGWTGETVFQSHPVSRGSGGSRDSEPVRFRPGGGDSFDGGVRIQRPTHSGGDPVMKPGGGELFNGGARSHGPTRTSGDPVMKPGGGDLFNGGARSHGPTRTSGDPVMKPGGGDLFNGGTRSHGPTHSGGDPVMKPGGGDLFNRGGNRGNGGGESLHNPQNPIKDRGWNGDRGHAGGNGHVDGSPVINDGGHLIHKSPIRLGGDHGIDVRHDPRPDPIYRCPDRFEDWDVNRCRRDGIYIYIGDVPYRYGYAYCNEYYGAPRWNYDRYCYEPSALVVVSPFYYYPELPPYLNVSCVTYGGYYPVESSFYHSYDYAYPGQGGFRRGWDDNPYQSGGSSYSYNEDRYTDRSKFDHALDDMVDAFSDGSANYVQNLIPNDGSVAILQDGYVRYSIGAGDFQNMYRDLIETTRSRGYQILDVRVYDDNSARVVAKHTRVDAYGNLTSVYHQYLLAYEGHRFVIRKFGVSHDRFR